MSSQDKYAELFASEAEELLGQISRAFVALEAEPDDRESIDAIFRSVHTLKGMAAAMGYESAAQLAHGIESALDAVRSGSVTIDPSLVDLLLHSADLLAETVSAAVSGDEAPDVAGAVDALETIQEREPSEADRYRGTADSQDGPPAARRPGTTRVRVDIRRLDTLMNLVGELIIERSRLEALAGELDSEPLAEAVDRTGRLLSEMQAEIIESRMVPVWQVFDRFPRVVRDTARSLDKEVSLAVSGKNMELDRSMLDAIGDPLIHLLRNAVDHGIERPDERERLGKPREGRLEVSARRERSRVVIEVKDDGRGVDRERVIQRAQQEGLLEAGAEPGDEELFRILARPGFSTSEEVTTVSGRGVGLNAVEDCVRSFGGSVEFRTEPGGGTTLRLELPLTLAIVRALIVEANGEEYALPTTYARESLEVTPEAIESAHGREWVSWRNELVPLTRLPLLFGGDEGNGSSERALNVLTLEVGGRCTAISVDRFIGEREVVVKSFDAPRGALPIFSGATVRPDGRPALILDAGGLS